MKRQLSSYIDGAITLLILLAAGLTPLLVFNQTTEFYEMPKLIFLVIITILLLGLWIFSWILKGKVAITRTPLDFPLLAMLVAVVISTYISISQPIAIFGSLPRVHGSAVAWVTYILLYFVTVSHLKTLNRIKSFLYVLYASGVVTAVLSVFAFFHLFLPFDLAKTVNFTPTGSSFSTIAFLLLLLPLPLLSLVRSNKYLSMPFAMVLSILFSITIVLLGSLPTYIALLITFVACFLVARHYEEKTTLALFFLPIIVTAGVLVLAYLPLPGGANKFQQLEANFPKEIQLPFAISWKTSLSSFRDAPFFGTGPASYLFNFTTYKPVEFNTLTYWNFAFDTAHDEFLQVLGTLGIFGFLSLALLCLVTLNHSRINLFLDTPDARQDSSHVLLPALSISAVLTVILLAIHATTLVSLVVTLFVLALFMMSQKSIREETMELSMGLKASTSNSQFDLLPIIIFIVFLIAAVPVLIRTYDAVLADFYHRQALTQADKSGTLTYQYLQKAETLNPVIDLYRVDMAQTNFALANAIAAKAQQNKNTTLSDQDKQTIQTLLSQAINEGRVSVALSPLSSRNWEVLAAIYRNIAGVAQNSLTYSLDAYGRAIQRDPLNPTLRLNVGGIYYTAKNYDLAIRFFTDAANLKPDYANAYFNLAIALREKGDLQSAQLVAQQVVALLQDSPNSQDYKTANALLNALKDQIAKGQANQNAQNAPASQTSSALDNPNLPKVNVSNLNNPPKPATPAAVKKNPNALIIPTSAPTAAPTR